MSLKNSSSSTSPSPSPDDDAPSDNTSPALINTPLTSKQSDNRDDPISRPHNNSTHISIPRSSSTGKGGCWTCRLRRKKCDEIRQGDSCHTCNRLKIKCLGWGSKRPEWMRDKQQVEAYKADIKAQLTRAGMIRGQPRSSMLQASTSTSSVFPTQQFHASPSGSRLPQLHNNDSPQPNLTFTEMMQQQNAAESPTIMSMYGSSLNSPFDIPLSLYGDPYPQLGTHSPSPYTPSTSLSSPHPSLNDLHPLEPTFDHLSPTLAFDPDTTAPALSSQSMQPDHVLYYFEHIRKLLFAFAGNSAANIIYSLVLQDPQGPVTNAICALASLHNMRVRAARGLEPMNHTLENSRAIMFYDTAHAQLYKNRQILLSEADAIAALHLLSFSLCSGGVTDWRTMLDIANEWMVQTGVTTHENPKLAMMNMSPAARLALKATMWLDVMSTITLHSTPKHLPFYRRLYRGGGGFWSTSGQYSSEEFDLRVDSVMGCPDEVILGIAEISHLACWKAQEMRKGSLSMRELIRRGDVIERHLRTQGEPVYLGDSDQTQLHPDLAIGGDGGATGMPGVVDSTRQLVARIFRETAVLYLHTVLSDPKPGVPEIIGSIDVIIQLLHQLPVTILDRTLIFPICLAGCLTDDPIRREIFKSRLSGQQDGFGNAPQALRVLETSWQRRDTRGGAVEWRDLLHVQGRYLLLLV
ncbi:fungal-specific transcription factor domain-containing protein [Phlebopus sp. FC_14]|nr:fungal-specific transcription factor domain-containing protein [Phlebopus sp. FC_14]